MKKSETIEINEKQYSISELTIRQIIEIVQNGQVEKSLALLSTDNKEFSLSQIFNSFLEEIRVIVNKCCSFTVEDLEDLAPSEIKELFECFKRVNSDFLSVLRETGIVVALSSIKERMVVDFSKVLAD